MTTISTFFLSLLFLFISLSVYNFQFHPSPLSPSQTLPPNTTSLNYVVRFLQYKPAHRHRCYLESSLRSDGWEWIERRNPASKYPTDFALVSVQDSVKHVFSREIGELELVKDVHVDMGYKRGLLNMDHEHKGGVFYDAMKRPGKMFTKMSFSEEEEEGKGGGTCFTIHNDSVRLGRELLGKVKYFVTMLRFVFSLSLSFGIELLLTMSLFANT